MEIQCEQDKDIKYLFEYIELIYTKEKIICYES
jgi:hypothetical protein